MRAALLGGGPGEGVPSPGKASIPSVSKCSAFLYTVDALPGKRGGIERWWCEWGSVSAQRPRRWAALELTHREDYKCVMAVCTLSHTDGMSDMGIHSAWVLIMVGVRSCMPLIQFRWKIGDRDHRHKRFGVQNEKYRSRRHSHTNCYIPLKWW